MKTYLIPINEDWLSGIRARAEELREVQKLVKVPMTSVATASRIYNAIGLGAGELEMILWAIENNRVEVVESEE